MIVPNSKIKNILTLSMLVSIFSLVFILSGCQKSAEEVIKEEKYTPVIVESVKKGTIEKTYTFSGYIKPVKEVNVMSKSVGEVSSVNFDIGDYVKEGQILFSMNKNTASNNVKSLQNQLETQLTQANSQVKSAKIQLDDAKKNLDDMTELYNKNSISSQQLESTKVAYEQAKVSYEAAVENYNLVTSSQSKSSLSAQIDIAKETLDDMEVESPISGIVSQRNVESGEIAASNIAFKISDISQVVLEISIPEDLINNVQTGQELTINIKSLGDKNFKGRITKILPIADDTTYKYPIEVLIDNSDGNLKAGMYAETAIVGESTKGTLIIPRNAILLSGENKYVYVVENDIAKRMDLTTGIDNGREIEVLEGISENQSLVVSGQDYLTDGEKVKVGGQNE